MLISLPKFPNIVSTVNVFTHTAGCLYLIFQLFLVVLFTGDVCELSKKAYVWVL